MKIYVAYVEQNSTQIRLISDAAGHINWGVTSDEIGAEISTVEDSIFPSGCKVSGIFEEKENGEQTIFSSSPAMKSGPVLIAVGK